LHFKLFLLLKKKKQTSNLKKHLFSKLIVISETDFSFPYEVPVDSTYYEGIEFFML